MPILGQAFATAKGKNPYNAATGGTEATMTNFNGTGQTWKKHTFTSNGTLTVTKSSQPFRVLTVGGGGSGGCGNAYYVYGGWGGFGQAIDTASVLVPAGAHTVTVGGTSGTSSLASYQSSGGGGGGGDGYQSGPTFYNGPNGSPHYGQVASNISGASVTYAAGHGSPNQITCQPGGGGPAYGGGGGGGGGNDNNLCGAKCGGGGAQGIVIVAYQIA